ncbi:armadillo-type protein [Dipodascopsis uninucleata]
MIANVGGGYKSDADRSRSSAFGQLRSVCVPLSQVALSIAKRRPEQNRDELVNRLLDLVKILEDLPAEELTGSIGDYVFFPLSQLLRFSSSIDDRSSELILQCVALLIRKCWVKDMKQDLAKQLIILIIFLVGGNELSKKRDDSSPKIYISVERKLAGCDCLYAIFIAASGSRTLKEFFLDASNILTLSHMILVLLNIVEITDEIACAGSAIDALTVLFNDVIADGEILGNFLPGCVSSISKALNPRIHRKNFKIIVKCIDLLRSVLVQVFNDKEFEFDSFGGNRDLDSVVENLTTGRNEHLNEDKLKLRSKKWLNASSAQVKIALDGICKLRDHHRPEVLDSLREFCSEIIKTCFESLKSSRSLLIDTLLYLGSVSNENISEKSVDFIYRYGMHNEAVQDIIKTSVYDKLQNIRLTLGSQDESTKLSKLKAIKTGLKCVFMWKTENSMIEETLLQCLKDSIVQLVFVPSVKITQMGSQETTDVALYGMDFIRSDFVFDGKVVKFPPIDIDYKLGLSTMEAISDMLRVVGSLNTTIVEDCLTVLESESKESKDKKVLYWIFVRLINGLKNTDSPIVDTNTTELMTRVCDELCGASIVLLENYMDRDALSIDDSNMVELVLEGISYVSDIMREDFKILMMDVLYPILNFIASSSLPLQRHAVITLTNVAYFTGYGSVSELLVDNVDYVLDSVSLRFNSLDISTRTPKVLSVLVKLAGSRAIPYLDDILASSFELLDNYHGYSTLVEGIFEVLKYVLEETWHTYEPNVLSIEDIPRRSRPGIWNLQGLIDEVNKIPEVILGDTPVDGDDQHKADDDSGSTTTEPERVEDEKWVSTIPKPWYMIVKKITLYGKYFLSHESPRIRFNVLELIRLALPSLSTEKKELLPVINDIWQMVVDRLDDIELYNVKAALLVIADCCQYSDDFMANRIQSTWPKLKNMLPVSIPKSREGKFSRSAQVLDATLSCLAVVVRYTRLKEDLFYDILDSTAPFLKYNKALKDSIEVVSSDALWVYLQFN